MSLPPSLGRSSLNLPGQYAAVRERSQGLARSLWFFYSRWRPLRKCVNPGIDMPRLRDFVLALFFAVLAVTAGRAQDAYPTHVVKIVVPSLPGSATDILARIVS